MRFAIEGGRIFRAFVALIGLPAARVRGVRGEFFVVVARGPVTRR